MKHSTTILTNSNETPGHCYNNLNRNCCKCEECKTLSNREDQPLVEKVTPWLHIARACNYRDWHSSCGANSAVQRRRWVEPARGLVQVTIEMWSDHLILDKQTCKPLQMKTSTLTAGRRTLVTRWQPGGPADLRCFDRRIPCGGKPHEQSSKIQES